MRELYSHGHTLQNCVYNQNGFKDKIQKLKVGGGLIQAVMPRKGKSLHPQAFLGAVLCIKPREYAHLIQQSRFYPCTGGLKI